MVAFNPSYRIEKVISKLNSNIKIIIVENSNNQKTKTYFENKFNNVEVILCKENHGVTRGFNIGFENTKTPYSLHLDMDVDFDTSIIEQFIESADKIKDFAFLVPEHQKSKYPSSWEFKPTEEDKEKIRMKKVHGHFMFFNMESVKKIGKFDEKIFFYFDETDYSQRATDQGLKIYLIKNMKVNHIGGSSYDEKLRVNIQPLRHWHLMWSKYYFYKKHHGTVFALLTTFPDLNEALIKLFFFLIINDKNKISIYKNRLLGLFNSIMGKKSWKRPERYY